MQIAELTWKDVEEGIARSKLALIPVGAVEVYGPHLPQGTDGIAAEALCAGVATEIECFVTPLVPVGWSQPLAGFPGTLNVSPEAVKEYCRGICESLLGWGVTSILFVNGHLGNVPPIDQLCFELRERYDARLAQVDIWRFIQPFTSDLLESPEGKFGHAGEAMTSLVLHLCPELARIDRIDGFQAPQKVDKLGLSQPHRYPDVLPTGLLGDASRASAEKGQQIFELTVRELVTFVREEAFAVAAEPARATR